MKKVIIALLIIGALYGAYRAYKYFSEKSEKEKESKEETDVNNVIDLVTSSETAKDISDYDSLATGETNVNTGQMPIEPA